jgi:hypothetical protein
MTRERTLTFPEDVAVGYLWASRGDTSVFKGPARGRIRVPYDARVSLHVHTPVVGLGELRASDIDSLEVPKRTTVDTDLARIGHLHGLRWLRCSKIDQCTDAGISSLAELRELQELDLYDAQVTDAGLVHLAGMVQLEALHLGGSRVRGPGLVALRGLQRLRWLSLEDTPLEDSALPHLFALGALRTLVVWGTRLSGAALNGLRTRMPQTEVVSRGRKGELIGARQWTVPRWN